MAFSSAIAKSLAQVLNPLTYHVQKIGHELKCPLCLNLLNKPMLLPCNHIYCFGCIANSAQFGSECPVCNLQFMDEDLRPAPHMENMVKILTSLDATYSGIILQPLPSGAGLPSELLLGNSQKTSEDKSGKEGTSSNRQSSVAVKAIMQNHDLLNACTGKEKALVCDVQDKAEQHVGLCTGGQNGLAPVQGMKITNEMQRVDIDRSLEHQPSPGSSSSFSAMRNRDCSSYDPLSTCSGTKICKIRKTRESELVMSGFEVKAEPTKENLGQVMDTKRQKQCYSLPDYAPQGRGNTLLGSSIEHVAFSKSNMQPEIKQDHIAAQGVVENTSVCAFCHSSKISDGSGEMLHFAKGKLVVGDISHRSNVIIVHAKCIDWTPQVYYEGDNIKNLEPELARAAKLKCSCCGLKGAGLGCYAKSCRKSYHVPCAYELEDCKWDCEDFLMLCPSHNNLKFPRERSNRRKLAKLDSQTDTYGNSGIDLATNHISSKQLPLWVDEPIGHNWVLCASALASEDRRVLAEFAKTCGATVTKNWKPNVTHVIAATEANDACRRTLKVLMAILHGKWIISMDWIKACIDAKSPVDEGPYEFGVDNHGCEGGPKAGRLRVMTNKPKLFDGLMFYFSGEFVPDCKSDLLDLILSAGGNVMNSKEQFILASGSAHTDNTESDTSLHIVVYNRDPPPGCMVGAGEFIVWQRKAEAEDLARGIRARVLRHTWILESIAACKLV